MSPKRKPLVFLEDVRPSKTRKRLGLAEKPAPNKRKTIPILHKVAADRAEIDPDAILPLTAEEVNLFGAFAAQSKAMGRPFDVLAFTRIALRAAARDYEAECESDGREAMALERAALRYVYELLKADMTTVGGPGFQDPSGALAAIENYAQALAKKIE